MISDIDALHISVKKYAEKCETTGDLTYIAKSNSLRRTADEKEEELKKVNEELDAKIKKYKEYTVLYLYDISCFFLIVCMQW